MANTTWNGSDKTANITLSNLNLTATQSASGANGGARAVQGNTNGKFYWECTLTTVSNVSSGVGMCASTATLNTGIGGSMSLNSCAISQGGTIVNSRATVVTGLGVLANGTIVGIALDCASGAAWFRLAPAGNWNNSGTANPATAAGGIALGFGAVAIYPQVLLGAQNNAVTANFGDSAFSGAVPSGFTAGFAPFVPTASLARAMILA